MIATEAPNLPADLSLFIDACEWTCARTMPAWPHEHHEHTVRGQVDDSLSLRLEEHTRAYGYNGHFCGTAITYDDDRGSVYWAMDPIDDTIMINRSPAKASYAYRQAHGTLPRR